MWLLTISLTLLGVVLALLPLGLPWLREHAAARRRGRIAREGLGAPHPVEGQAGVETTLAGRLELSSDPCAQLGGGSAVAETALLQRGDRVVAAIRRRAEGVVLVTDQGARVALDGPIEVQSGSEERYPGRPLLQLPQPLRLELLRAATANHEEARRSRVSLRAVSAGERALVRGRLEPDAQAPEEALYRTPPPGWRLVGRRADGASSLLLLASEERPRVSTLSRERVSRAVVAALLALLFFAALPWSLGGLAEWLQDKQLDELGERGSFDAEAGQWTDRLWIAQGGFPGWRKTAQQGRVSLVEGVANHLVSFGNDILWGYYRRSHLRACESCVAFVSQQLPQLVGSAWFAQVRLRVEENLYRAGRDRPIVELGVRLPPGGNVRHRVIAQLSQGDLEGAAATWKEPGAFADELLPEVAGKANVLCMAGDFEAALEAFAAAERQLAPEGESSDMERAKSASDLADHLFRYGECLRRAGKLERAAGIAERLARTSEKRAAHLRALIEVQRENYKEALAAVPAESFNESLSLMRLWLLSRQGRAAEALGEARWLCRFSRQELSLESIYNVYLFSWIDERLLRESADALATSPEAAVRAVAGGLYLELALRQGRRWDVHTNVNLELAAKLRPDAPEVPATDREQQDSFRPTGPAVARLRLFLAYLHGRWDDLDDLPQTNASRPLRALVQAFRGASQAELDAALSLSSVTLSKMELALAKMYTDGLTNQQRLDLLQLRLSTVTRYGFWMDHFRRLTAIIVHGEHMGLDVSAQKYQLMMLRKMFARQPNPLLLAT